MSLTLSSLFAMLLNWYVQKQKINLGVGDLQNWVEMTITLLAPIGIWYGRWRAGGVTVLGLRTKK